MHQHYQESYLGVRFVMSSEPMDCKHYAAQPISVWTTSNPPSRKMYEIWSSMMVAYEYMIVFVSKLELNCASLISLL